MAAPFGPPPVRATTVCLPSGATRVRVPRLISTTSTLPSARATGPSGNWRPLLTSRISGMVRSSLDGHDGPPLAVELVQVLGDAVAGVALVGPAREPLVDERAPPAHLVRHRRHAEAVAAQRVHAPALVGGAHVGDRVGEAVGRELGADGPRADARRLAVAPHPAAVEIARLGADADAAEVHPVADVDREPAPHGGSAPAPRPPRLVAIAARLAERVVHPVGLDPAAPAAGLLEVPLADARARGGARPGAGAALAVAPDRRRERAEDEVAGGVGGAGAA